MDIRKPKTKTRLLNIYKILILIFVIILILMPNSVTSMPEIETKLLLTVIGLDKTETGYRVSATAVMPQESQNGSTKRLDVDAEDTSISAALEKLSLKMGKKLELGLCGLVVVGNTFGEESLLPHFEYLLSSAKIIPGAYLVFSPDHSAKETIEMSNKLSEATSNGLSKLIEHNALSTNMPAVTLLKFLSQTGSVTKSSYLPCIDIQKKQSGQSGQESGSSGGEDSSGGGSDASGGDETEIITLSHIALYRDGVFRSVLSELETRGFTWCDKSSTKGLVTLENLKIGELEVGEIYCQLKDKKFGMKTSLDGEVARAEITLEATMDFEDRYKLSDLYKYHGISEEEITENIRRQYNDSIRNELEVAIAAMKEVDCDAMGLTNHIYRYNFKQYKACENKDALFSSMEIDYNIKVRFR